MCRMIQHLDSQNDATKRDTQTELVQYKVCVIVYVITAQLPILAIRYVISFDVKIATFISVNKSLIICSFTQNASLHSTIQILGGKQ